MALPNLSQIQQALDAMLPKLKPIDLPTGTYGYFHSVPDGWLECNGAAVSRTTYADLFKVIGTKYGAGDGSTTFNLPDMNGRVLQATTNHSEVGQMKEASLPNISGRFNVWKGFFRKNSESYAEGAFGFEEGTSNYGAGQESKNDYKGLDFSATRSSPVYSGSRLQPSAALTLLCIKA